MSDRWVFLYGFAKNERANIDRVELKALQEVAKQVLGFDKGQLETALSAGELLEVCDDNENA